MRRLTRLATLALATLAAGAAPNAIAFDHADGPAAVAAPATDITGLYAWMSGGKLEVALNVTPSATAMSRFATDALYVIHVNRSESYGATATESTIVCKFDTAQQITCWPGEIATEVTTGDPSTPTGVSSASGKFKVFAGLRADPEQTNLDGIQDSMNAITGAFGALMFNQAGCPLVDAATSSVLVQKLRTDLMGGSPVNAFGTANVLSIVMEVDLALLSGSGNILGVWASTNKL